MSSLKPTVVEFVAVGWTKKGEELLANEVVEVVALRHLVVTGKGSPQAGTEVSMQYHNEIWEGHILSVHDEQFCQHLSSEIS